MRSFGLCVVSVVRCVLVLMIWLKLLTYSAVLVSVWMVVMMEFGGFAFPVAELRTVTLCFLRWLLDCWCIVIPRI